MFVLFSFIVYTSFFSIFLSVDNRSLRDDDLRATLNGRFIGTICLGWYHTWCEHTVLLNIFTDMV